MKNIKVAISAVLAVILLGVTGYLIAAGSFLPTPAANEQPVGYVAQLQLTDYNVSSGNSTVFRGYYEREYWSGNLYAYPVDARGAVNEAAEWWTGGAAARLQSQNYNTGRMIATMKDDGSKIPFRWASLSAAQQASIGDASTGPNILNFVRGDRSNEISSGGTYRSRNPETVLGDIIHSRPNYVANGSNPVIFVGANDGMLHAFDARTGGGSELWAYVPSMLIGNLNKLAVSPYVHTYFVDGGLNIGDVTISGVSKKVLVSALGAGGKGLFALDVTTPTATSESDAASKLLWEITPSKINATASASYANLGYTYGVPLIVQLNTAGNPWAAIIGNGYNNTGNGHGVIYVINIADGTLIKAIDTGSGTLASPSGLATPAAIDIDTNGTADRLYAGDIDGKLWKFDISSADTALWTASLLYTTSPAQAITMAPAVATHTAGGYMVTFGTGRMFTTGTGSDFDDTSVHYVYGVWDGAPVANAAMLTQTLTEKSYASGCTVALPDNCVAAATNERVRTVTNNAPNWTSGAANHKGWKVALPAGERVVGDTVFIENGRFYFNATDPTKTHTTPTPNGDNWLMELNYMNGGSADTPFLDLNGDLLLTNADRIKYFSTDTLPAGKVVGDVVVNGSGVIDYTSLPVGKFVSHGVSSHPLLIQLATLNTTLINQNPDVTVPVPPVDLGVAGGHFDEDVYYKASGDPGICAGSSSGGASAIATITVGSTGSTFPATLGGIQVDGVTIVPALTTTTITNGSATTTNATTIKNLVTGGFTATVASNVITVSAPAGSSYNGKTFTILAGTSAAGSPATTPTAGALTITDVTKNKSDVSVKCGSTYVTGAPGNISSINDNDLWDRLDDLYTKIHGKTVNGYTTTCSKVLASGKTNRLDCSIAAPAGPSNCATFTLSRISQSTNTGPSGGSAATGYDNLAPALTTSGLFTGGADGSFTATSCTSKSHTHQYDDKFDRTGVNMLNASVAALNLSNAIPSTSTQFKVLVQNQYLSPAVKLSIGDPNYIYSIDAGYVRLKDYATSAPLTSAAFAALPTYTRATVGSLAINMPVDAFTPKNWWGDGTPNRVGLHPTVTGCVKSSKSGTVLNMFQPVIPPANGTNGPGTNSTDTTGVRHNGALVVQVIKAETPYSAIEESVSGRPEYGWRVKSANFESYVLAEWTTFWHHTTLNKCYGDSGWKYDPGTEDSSSAPSTPASGATDPKLGAFGASQGGVDTVTTTTGTAVLTVTATGVTITVTTTAGVTVTGTATGTMGAAALGTKSVSTKITRINYLSGAWTEIHTASNGDGSSTLIIINSDGSTETYVIPDKEGNITTGGDEKGSQSKTGRISWTELFR